MSARSGAAPSRATRGRAALALAIPCAGGLAALAFLGAPGLYLAVNAAALAAALLSIFAAPAPAGQRARLAAALAFLGVLALPLMLGPQINGVARWITLGPLSLHTAALCLPSLVCLAADEERAGPLLLAAAAAVLAWQPDAAGLLALGLAGGVLAALGRSMAYGLLALACLALAALTFGAGALEPQPFVEYVLADLSQRSPLAAVALASALLSGIGLVVTGPSAARAPMLALAALLAGFALAATLGPFPYPLIAYGAAPILGFGHALAFCSASGLSKER